jgi:hypothetical protein
MIGILRNVSAQKIASRQHVHPSQVRNLSSRGSRQAVARWAPAQHQSVCGAGYPNGAIFGQIKSLQDQHNLLLGGGASKPP